MAGVAQRVQSTSSAPAHCHDETVGFGFAAVLRDNADRPLDERGPALHEPHHPHVAVIAIMRRPHRLSRLPSWFFLHGSPPPLPALHPRRRGAPPEGIGLCSAARAERDALPSDHCCLQSPELQPVESGVHPTEFGLDDQREPLRRQQRRQFVAQRIEDAPPVRAGIPSRIGVPIPVWDIGGLDKTTSNGPDLAATPRSPRTTRTLRPRARTLIRAVSTARDEMSTAVTDAAPSSAAVAARKPVPVQKSNTRASAVPHDSAMACASRNESSCGR